MLEQLYDENGRFSWRKLPKSEVARAQLLVGFEIPEEFESISERLWFAKNQKERPRCECGSFTSLSSLSDGFREFCSNRCQGKSKKTIAKKKQTCLLNYGVEWASKSDIVQNKVKATNLKKYGVEHPLQNHAILEKTKNTNLERYGKPFVGMIKEFHEKKIITNLEKYGHTCSLANSLVHEKTEKTNLERYGHKVARHGEENKKEFSKKYLVKYGVEHPFQREDVKEKTRETTIRRYGVDHTAKIDGFRNQCQPEFRKTILNRIQQKLQKHNIFPLFDLDSFTEVSERYNFRCSKCDFEFISTLINGTIPRCIKCHPHRFGKKQFELFSLIKSVYNGVILYNDRLAIAPKELDILLPLLNLAFEFNGTFWHSERFLPKDYHDKKSALAKSVGIKLIHIWEKEWDQNRIDTEKIILKHINDAKNNTI